MFFSSFWKCQREKIIFDSIKVLLAAVFVLSSLCPISAGAQESDFIGRGIQEENGGTPDESVAATAGESSQKEEILPDSPLYKVKTFFELLTNLFTFKPASKAERYVELAEKRVAEIRAMVEMGKATEEAVETNVKKFEDNMQKALLYAEKIRQQGDAAEDLLNKISTVSENYKKITEDFYGNLPPQVKASIDESVKWLNQAQQDVLSRIPEEKKNQIFEAGAVIKAKIGEIWNLLKSKLKK